MLRISSPKAESSAECTPNLLPCRIHHNGPVNASKRYWDPQNTHDDRPEAYFRGRKLKGKEVKVLPGYEGIIVKEAAKKDIAVEARGQGRQDREDEEDDEEEPKELQQIGSFDEIMLWGHETVVEDDDAFAKGMGEWIRFAEAVRSLIFIWKRARSGY